jgi:hypothetical protein
MYIFNLQKRHCEMNCLYITLFFNIVAGTAQTNKSWNHLLHPRVTEVCRLPSEPRHDFFLHRSFVRGCMVRVLNPDGTEIFRTRPDRPWGPPSLLYNAYRVFPGRKAAGAWPDHPPPSTAEVKERVEQYLYSPSRPSWPVLGWTLPLLYLS